MGDGCTNNAVGRVPGALGSLPAHPLTLPHMDVEEGQGEGMELGLGGQAWGPGSRGVASRLLWLPRGH